MDLARAAIQHALDVGDQYKQNMALRHGLERPDRLRIDQSLPVAEAIVEPVMQAAAPSAQSLLSRSFPWLAAGALSLGTGGVGAGLASYFLSRPSPQVAAPVVEAETGLLSDLQERGFHLPPAGAGR